MPPKQSNSSLKNKNQNQKSKLSSKNSPSSRNNPNRSVRNVSAPANQSLVIRSMNGPHKCVTAHHRAIIAEVFGSTAFSNHSIWINPGLEDTFPWLHYQAICYETYTFKDLRLQYVGTCSSATEGSVVLSADFDAADPAPEDIVSAMSYDGSVMGPAWSSYEIDFPKLNLEKMCSQRYCRYGALAPNLDVKTYDVGRFNVSTQGFASDKSIGFIYADYVVEFQTPQLPSSDERVDYSYYSFNTTDKAKPFLNVTTSSGTQLIKKVSDTVLKVTEAGDILLQCMGFGTSLIDTVPTLTLPDGGSIINSGGAAVAAATSALYYYILHDIPLDATITVDPSPSCATLTNFNVRASRYGGI